MKSIERCALTYSLVAHPPSLTPHTSLLMTLLCPQNAHGASHARPCRGQISTARRRRGIQSKTSRVVSTKPVCVLCPIRRGRAAFPLAAGCRPATDPPQPAVPGSAHSASPCSAVYSCHSLFTCLGSVRLDLTHSHIALSACSLVKEGIRRQPLRWTWRPPHCCATR